jgi:hypothetical protein
MRIELYSTAVIAKSINIKREKDDHDAEVVIAHLKFAGCFLTRDQIDELCQQPIGWSAVALFDEGGTSRGHFEIAVRGFSGSVTGTIRGGEGESAIKLVQATLTDVVLQLHKLGALLAGHLSWAIAGDEASDAECLLGQVCGLKWIIQEPEQGDWIKRALLRGDGKPILETAPA